MNTLKLNEKFERLNIESTKTINEALDKMNIFGKVMVIRPTGFGKTRMLVNIAKLYGKKYKNKRIAYIYPLDIIVTEIQGKAEYLEGGVIDNQVDFISYQLLTKRFNENGEDYWYNKFKTDYSIIMLDEVHSAGSEGFNNIYNTLKEAIKPDGLHLIGVTATPNRMDDTIDFNVLESIFDSIQVYKFDLGDCFRIGIIPKLIIGTRQYDLDYLAKELKLRKKEECARDNRSFDEKMFNVELGKLMKANGTEGEYIYKYINKAGYNLASAEDKYFKFIVFFNNIADMGERGPEVEEWFTDAFNNVAKKELGLRREFDIESYYVASSDTEENSIEALVKENEHRKFLRKTKKLNNIERDSYRVDLLFTVNMINMGYHVEDITGIMMLRGTRSEVIYYQQLGRALSVKATHSPIIYDMVQNKNAKFWSKKDSQRSIQKTFEEAMQSSGLVSGEGKDTLCDLDIFAEGDEDEADDFLRRWSDSYYSEYAKILYMYTDRYAPLCIIANDMNKKCTEIAKILNDNGIELRPEDSMHVYHESIVNNINKDKEMRKYSYKILKALYSKKSYQFFTNQNKEKKETNCLYSKILSIISKK